MQKYLLGLILTVLMMFSFVMNATPEEVSAPPSEKETQEAKPSEAQAATPGC